MKSEQVAQEGNNRSPEEQLVQGINIIQNSKRPLMELLKLLELKPKPHNCITKMPYEEIFWHPRALNCEASSPIQLKFEFH